MERYLLLASQPMKDLAAEVVSLRHEITLGEITWKHFPDTFPDTLFHDVEGLKRSHVNFLACFDKPETIFEQMSVMYTLASMRPRSLRFLLPYFPTGTMERRDHEGQVATAGTLAQMFSAVAPAGPGSVPLFIWDIHALPIREFFGPNISPQFKTGTKLLKEKLIGRDISIVFPDEGAYKRFHSMFEENGKRIFPSIICRKQREGDKREVSIIEGSARGRDVVIVDDLMHSGGTTIECARVLRDAGARSVSAYATHGVLERAAWKKFLAAGFEKVWITNSCPETALAVRGVEPFEILSLAKSIGNAVVWPND